MISLEEWNSCEREFTSATQLSCCLGNLWHLNSAIGNFTLRLVVERRAVKKYDGVSDRTTKWDSAVTMEKIVKRTLVQCFLELISGMFHQPSREPYSHKKFLLNSSLEPESLFCNLFFLASTVWDVCECHSRLEDTYFNPNFSLLHKRGWPGAESSGIM